MNTLWNKAFCAALYLFCFESNSHELIKELEIDDNVDIRISRIQSKQDLPFQNVASGNYRVHMIDVGTGLSILVQGADFNMLFDAGSQDDWAGISNGKNKSRVIAYLGAVLGTSNTPKTCPQPFGDRPQTAPTIAPAIDHIFLSHVHKDHGNMLDEVLQCFSVSNVWDTAIHNEQSFYKNFIKKVAQEEETIFHTAVRPPEDKNFVIGTSTINLSNIKGWTSYQEGDKISLGNHASFKILHKDTTPHHDPNTNSMVIRVDLGNVSLLLTGDAESGDRLPPNSPLGDIELKLIEQHPDLVDVDILQVGHHGSLTSSRRGFLEKVSPKIALVSSGPKSYSGKTLPDKEVILELEAQGAIVLRTDARDSGDKKNQSGCGNSERIGKEEKQPGGCDNYLLEIKG